MKGFSAGRSKRAVASRHWPAYLVFDDKGLVVDTECDGGKAYILPKKKKGAIEEAAFWKGRYIAVTITERK